MQYPSMVRRPITTSVAQRAHAASWRVLPSPERQPAQWRLFAIHANAGCALKAIFARRTTVLRRERKAFRRCSTLLWCVGRSQPAWHGAHVRQACVLRHLPKDSQRSGACSRATRMTASCWRPQLARRTTVVRRKKEASRRCSTLPWRVGQSQRARHGARARQACVLRHLTKDSQRSGASSRAMRMPAERCGSHPARRSTVLRRKREAFRRSNTRP